MRRRVARRRRNPRLLDYLPTLLTVGAIGVGAYLIYRLFKKPGEKAAEAAANVLEWFFPFDAGEKVQYSVQFPDGTTHAVGSRAVQSDGTFTVPTIMKQGDARSGGQVSYYAVADIPNLRGKYRLAVDRSILIGNNKKAIKL